MRGKLKTEQNCNILTPTLVVITAFLSRSPGLLNRGPGGPTSLGHDLPSSIFFPTDLLSKWSELQLLNRESWGPLLLGAGFLYSMLSPTNSNFLCTELYHCFTPTRFNLLTVKVIPLIPSTGCTCYLYRCISLFWLLVRVGGQYATIFCIIDSFKMKIFLGTALEVVISMRLRKK